MVKDSLFAASCCSILVVKGLGADFLLVLASIEFTTISDLISTSEFYLNDNSVATALFYALKQDDELKQIELLLSICENSDIK